MNLARWRDNDRVDHELAGAFLVLIGLLASLVAGVILVAAVNPGYKHQWYLLKGGIPIAILAVAVVCWSVWLMRFRLRVATTTAVVVLCLAAGLVLGGGYLSRPEKSVAAATNLAGVESIRAPEGATVVSDVLGSYREMESWFEEGFLNPPDGYFLERTYALPSTMTLKGAIAFYTSELRRHGWQVRRETTCADCAYLLASDKYSGTAEIRIFQEPNGRIIATV